LRKGARRGAKRKTTKGDHGEGLHARDGLGRLQLGDLVDVQRARDNLIATGRH
jgi:hypothetical protein